jgi:hypothetical protein
MSEKQKIITFGVKESLHSRISDVASSKGQKASDYIKKFVNDYFTDDKEIVRIVLDVPKDKRGDKLYMREWFKQKADYIIESLYDQLQKEKPDGPWSKPSAYDHLDE